MVNDVTGDNVLEIIVHNKEKSYPQQGDNNIRNRIIKIRNTSTITDRKEVIHDTPLSDNSSVQNSDNTKSENMTPTITLNSIHSSDRQFLNIFHQNIRGLRHKTNEVTRHITTYHKYFV